MPDHGRIDPCAPSSDSWDKGGHGRQGAESRLGVQYDFDDRSLGD